MRRMMKGGAVLTGGFPYKGTLSEQLRFVLAYGAAAVPPSFSTPWAYRLEEPLVEIRLERDVNSAELRAGAFWAGAATFGMEIAMRCFLLGPEIELLPDPRDPSLLARLEATFVSLPSREDLGLLAELERPTPRHQETDGVEVSLAEWQVVQEAAGHEFSRLTILDTEEGDPSMMALSTRGDNVLDWLRAGRAFSRVWLAARGAGLAVHPSTTIPVTPEMRLGMPELRGVLGVTQAVLTLGHPIDLSGNLYGPAQRAHLS